MKYTWYGQILSVITAHIEAAFVLFLIWFFSISITGTRLGGLIYSAVSAVVYAAVMYLRGYTTAGNDKKSYTKLSPIAYKGAVISLGLLFLNILPIFIYNLSWAIGSDGENLVNIWAIGGNAFCIFWFSPYLNLLGMDKGSIAVYGYAVIALLHTIACFLGYFAGYKNFDISEKLRLLVYEKKQ